MRVIAGTAKGHRLKSPKGLSIRPTSDLVRGAIFSMLESLPVDWSHALDLYAGTGALGIEALSRRAEWADFVEKDQRCCTLIRENLKATGLTEKARVYCLRVEKALTLLQGEYGIVLLDPPYSEPLAPTFLDNLFSSGLTGAQSTIVVQHPRRLSLQTNYGDFQRVKNLCHGDTLVSAYQFIGRN